MCISVCIYELEGDHLQSVWRQVNCAILQSKAVDLLTNCKQAVEEKESNVRKEVSKKVASPTFTLM